MILAALFCRFSRERERGGGGGEGREGRGEEKKRDPNRVKRQMEFRGWAMKRFQ